MLDAIVTRAGTNLCQVWSVKYREWDELSVFFLSGSELEQAVRMFGKTKKLEKIIDIH